jgi:hypothetical protein
MRTGAGGSWVSYAPVFDLTSHSSPSQQLEAEGSGGIQSVARPLSVCTGDHTIRGKMLLVSTGSHHRALEEKGREDGGREGRGGRRGVGGRKERREEGRIGVRIWKRKRREEEEEGGRVG